MLLSVLGEQYKVEGSRSSTFFRYGGSDMRVLLVEPDYRSKFPPLGLLKIGSYHKSRGDEVRLVRGILKEIGHWDRIYISTLFSYHHHKVIQTILHYKETLGGDVSRLFVGGAYATLFPEVIFKETGVWPVVGLVNAPNMLGLGDEDANVDQYIHNHI